MQASVYRALPNGTIKPMQVFHDGDAEDFYVCTWSIDVATGAPLLLLGGKASLVKSINCSTGVLEACLEGHGQCINDIAVHPTRPHLVISASRDNSLRLWNLRTKVCILILQGDGGHRNEVLSADWKPGGGVVMASAGMDSCVKIWDLAPYEDWIRKSDDWRPSSGAAFAAKHVTVPTFSTRVVHFNYVDCMRWLGDFLLTKSVDNQIVCWKPVMEDANGNGAGTPPAAAPGGSGAEGDVHTGESTGVNAIRVPPPWRRGDGEVQQIQRLQLEDSKHVWWMRFSLDYKRTVLAAGTAQGRVLVFDPTRVNDGPVAKLRPRRAGSRGDGQQNSLLVRQTTVSFDGGIIVTCHEDGSVTRFDKVAAQ